MSFDTNCTDQIRRRCGPAVRTGGFSLVEMMISMTLGLVIIAGAGQLFISGKRIFNLQQVQASYQEQTTLLGTMIAGLLRQTGNVEITGMSIDRERIFLADTEFPSSGQVIKGNSASASRKVLNEHGSTTGSFPNDSITFRFVGGTGIFDCEGNATANNTQYEHTLSIRNDHLVCQPSAGVAPVELIGTRSGPESRRVRVLGLRVLYGIDSNDDGSIDDYNKADEMSSGDWLAVVNSWLEVTIQPGDLPPSTIRFLIHYSNLS